MVRSNTQRQGWMQATAVAVFSVALLSASVARAQSPSDPLDPQTFTNFIAKMLRLDAPHAQVSVVAPLRLTVKSPTIGEHDVFLDRIHDACVRNPNGCALDMQNFVEGMAASYEHPDPPLDRKALRVIVRDQEYFDQAQSFMKDHGGPVAQDLAGGYHVMLAADLPTTIKILPAEHLASLGLSSEQALAIGKRNMAAAMRREIKAALASDPHAIAGISDTYASSLLAAPELWAPLAARFGGKLLVAAPAADVVLCGDGSDPGMARQMARQAREVMKTADRPLTDAVFAWSPDGWTPLPPQQRQRR